MHMFAYVDPGAGALVWQFVVAAIVGAMFYVRRMRTAVGALLRKAVRFGRISKLPEPPETILQETRDKDSG